MMTTTTMTFVQTEQQYDLFAENTASRDLVLDGPLEPWIYQHWRKAQFAADITAPFLFIAVIGSTSAAIRYNSV